jgi:hypothetical protein
MAPPVQPVLTSQQVAPCSAISFLQQLAVDAQDGAA